MKLTSISTMVGAVALMLTAGTSSAVTMISPAPVTPDPVVADIFDVTISGSGFDIGTSGGGLSVSWDASILDLISVTPVFPLCDPLFNPCGTGDLDQAAGTLSDMDFLSITAGISDSSFDIVTLSFLAQSAGTSAITTALGNFPGSGANPWVDESGFFEVFPIFEAGSVTVSAVPVPAAVWLFGSGLIGLVGMARRKRSA